jgi:hypothetical protein
VGARARLATLALPALILGGLAAGRAQGQVLSDLEPERPVSIEDARPIPYRALSGSIDWTYTGREHQLDDYGPGFSLLYGAMRGLEVGANIRYVTRPERNSHRGISSGDLFLHALYGIRTEDAYWPALAIKVAVQFPTGLDSKGTDLHVTALATRSFEGFRLHANFIWTHLGAISPFQRRDLYEGIAGTDILIHPRGRTDTLAVADVAIRTNPIIGGTAIVTVEGGLRQKIGMQTVLFAGAGSDIRGEHADRARYRVRLGVTHRY